MIKYQRDYVKQYDDTIKTILRGHNQLFSNIHDFSSLFVYVLEGETLIGALNVSYFWNWVSIGDVFYKDNEILKHLVKNAWDFYKEKAIGMKLFTTVKMRLNDFISAGFIGNGTVELTDTKMYYYADLKVLDFHLKNEYNVLISEEPLERYQEELGAHTKTFNKEYQIEDAFERYDLAALDYEQCVGGLQGDVYSDMLYINRLAVDLNYRKRSIGKTLMSHAIDYAKEKDLDFVMLGTCEFQAKDFYKKLGFEVVYVRENNPIGYKSYTMLKRLK